MNARGEGIRLILYDKPRLERVLRDFYRLTGINIVMLDVDFRLLVGDIGYNNDFCRLIQTTPEGRARCSASDHDLLSSCRQCGHAMTHHCHAGLSDMAVPLLEGKATVGYLLFGQVCEKKSERPLFSDIWERVKDLAVDFEQLEKAYAALSFFDKDRIESATEIVTMLTKYIWIEDMILSHADTRFERLVEYIDTHVQEPLTVGGLCGAFHISKNVLYAGFREKYQCTVNQYLTNRRMGLAKQLLCATELPVSRVGEEVGISDTNYFCRLFKKEAGVSPLQYRKGQCKP